MGRSGYSVDCEYLELWRASVGRSINGARGQHFLRKLRTALDALAQKRLVADRLSTPTGEVCALGSVDPKADVDAWDREQVAAHFGIAPSLAAEIAYVNDEAVRCIETPEQRWVRMRAWVEVHINKAFD